MIFKKMVLGPMATNSYIIGSDITKEVALIDPGYEPNKIIEEVEKIGAKPIAILLTHGHFDHTMHVDEIIQHFPDAKLMYNKKEYDPLQDNKEKQDIGRLVSDLMDNKKDNAPEQYKKEEEEAMELLNKIGRFSNVKADRWLEEGDVIEIGEITLVTLETPGHSPGGLSFYSSDVKEVRSHFIDGIIFTGDLLLRRDVGAFSIPGGDEQLLYSSIKNKIMNNPDLTDHFKVFGGHMGDTTIAEERTLNPFRKYFS